MLFGFRHSEEREAVSNRERLLRPALASDVGETRLDQLRPLSESPRKHGAACWRLANPPVTSVSVMETHDEVRRLFICIDTPEARDVQFIRSIFLLGSTYAELADRATLPLPTVKSRIRRALLKLRKCLADA